MNAISPQRRQRSTKAPRAAKPPARARTRRSPSVAPAAATSDGPAAISEDERRRMIAIAAYHRAERRGFIGGTPEQDWLEAEAEIDHALGGCRS